MNSKALVAPLLFALLLPPSSSANTAIPIELIEVGQTLIPACHTEISSTYITFAYRACRELGANDLQMEVSDSKDVVTPVEIVLLDTEDCMAAPGTRQVITVQSFQVPYGNAIQLRNPLVPKFRADSRIEE
jgi:hypothetical protein